MQHPATHHPLFSDLHPSLPDGVHGPFYNFVLLSQDTLLQVLLIEFEVIFEPL